MRICTATLTLAALLTLVGCSTSNEAFAPASKDPFQQVDGRLASSSQRETVANSRVRLAANDESGFAADASTGVPGAITARTQAADATAPATPTPQPRIIIYSGSIRMVVSDINSTLESIKKMGLAMGGYVDQMDRNSITLRIPAEKFDLAMSEVQRHGEVADRQLKAADVTDQMRDLGIRLNNARQTRQQLLALLDKSAKVEDTLKIEAELERVTEQVELIEGKVRYLQQQVAFSVLAVELNSPLPQAQLVAVIPFPWVRELGQGAVTGGAPETAERSGWFGGGVNFDLPPGYIRFHQHDDLTEAMSADGVMIKATRHDNYKGGDLKFWSTLARRALLNNGSIAVKQDATVNSHIDLIEGIRNLAGGDQGYMLLIIVSGDRVQTYEAWGPRLLVERDRDILRKAGESMAR